MIRLLLAVALLATCLTSSARAQTEEEKQLRDRWMTYYQKQAASYEIICKGETEQRLEFQPKNLFQYTNPVREYGQHGAFFVWTLDGRPEVVGTVWSTIDRQDKTKRNVAHEIHSLSLAPLESKRPAVTDVAGRTVPQWSTGGPGIEFKPLDAKPPAANPAGRLIQMRQLAREFSAISKHPKEESPRNLRLVTQPVYRYASPKANVIDGAIFSFVMATDPEILLLLEAHQTAAGPQWHFAAARFTHIPAELRHDDQVVWQCGPAAVFAGDQPFFLYMRMIQLDADDPGT